MIYAYFYIRTCFLKNMCYYLYVTKFISITFFYFHYFWNFLQVPESWPTAPTHFTVNKYTYAFQEFVNTYGIPRYREANPALFTAATFPFLFGKSDIYVCIKCIFTTITFPFLLFMSNIPLYVIYACIIQSVYMYSIVYFCMINV